MPHCSYVKAFVENPSRASDDNANGAERSQTSDSDEDQDDPAKQYDEAGLNAPHIVDTVLNALRHNSAGVEEARA